DQDSATVELRRGGSGKIRVLGWKEVEDGALELRPSGGARSEPLPAPDPDGAVYLMGLPEGNYVVALRRGSPDIEGPDLAAAEIRAAPGRPFSANLDARGGGAPPGGRVLATVEYPEERLLPGQR